ncbi:MAG: low-specificity L-threonine aldolase [Thermoflexales bacterium]|nr:low-specificity L-threonine aldolase [Thermoflexales bacterium]
MAFIVNGQRVIDLRSDTVTQPMPGMREAMARAEVGDDVYGEDPSVNRLESVSAELMGQEAGLFVASGTMGNLVALLTHCGRGDEVILGDQAHSFVYEAGGSAAVGGIHPHTVKNQADGTLRLEEVEAAIRDDKNVHFPCTRLICLENTHNRCAGSVLSVAYTRAVSDLAHTHGLGLHIDGARIFNAAASLGVPARELAEPADSITFCLSKGLCAPVGAVVCGSRDFIRQARRHRKLIGGGMRQAGVLAAAGLIALEQGVPRLGQDHANARRLAEGLAAIAGLTVEPVHTNMVYFRLAPETGLSDEQLLSRLAERGVKLMALNVHRFRAVLHYWVDGEDVEVAVDTLREVIRKNVIRNT